MSENNTPEAEAPNNNQGKKQRSEETIKRQILTNAKKYLANLAAERAKITEQYEAPTHDQIVAECKKRWQERLDRGKAKEDVTAYFE